MTWLAWLSLLNVRLEACNDVHFEMHASARVQGFPYYDWASYGAKFRAFGNIFQEL